MSDPNSHICECVEFRTPRCAALDQSRNDIQRVVNSYNRSIGRSRFPMLIRSGREVKWWKRETFPTSPRPLETVRVVLGVTTNVYVENHWRIHKRVAHRNVVLRYVSCMPLGYNNDSIVVLPCKYTQRRLITNQVEQTLLWFNFVHVHYKFATHVGKIDTDTFVHPRNLLRRLSTLPPRQLVYGKSCWVDPCFFGTYLDKTGLCQTNRRMVSCARVTSKPCGFCGGMYIMTHDVLRKIQRKSALTRYPSISHWIASFGHTEDGLMSHLVQSAYGANFTFASDNFDYIDMHQAGRGFGFKEHTQPLGLTSSLVAVHQVKASIQWNQLFAWLNWSRNGRDRCTPKRLYR